MIRKSLLSLIALGACSQPAFAGGISYDPAAAFSPTTNPNGVWSYGWSEATGSAFLADTLHENVAGLDFWEGGIETGATPGSFPTIFHNGTDSTINFTGTVSVAAGQLAMHPGPDGQYSVLQFTVPSAGTYSLSSTFTALDFIGPTTTDVHVLLNNVSLFDGIINNLSDVPTFFTSQPLNAGDTLSFAVGYGSNRNYFSDSTGIAVNITSNAAPEPTSLFLVGLGLLGAKRRIRNRSGRTRLANPAMTALEVR